MFTCEFTQADLEPIVRRHGIVHVPRNGSRAPRAVHGTLQCTKMSNAPAHRVLLPLKVKWGFPILNSIFGFFSKQFTSHSILCCCGCWVPLVEDCLFISGLRYFW